MKPSNIGQAAKAAIVLCLLVSLAAAAAGCRAEIGSFSSSAKQGDIVYVPNIDVNYLAYKCGLSYGQGSLRVLYDGNEVAMRSSGSPQSTALVFRAGGDGKHYIYFSDAPGTPRNDAFPTMVKTTELPAYYFSNGETADFPEVKAYPAYVGIRIQWQAACRGTPAGRTESYVFKRNGEQAMIPYRDPVCLGGIAYGSSSIALADPADYVFPAGYMEIIHYPLPGDPGWQWFAQNQITSDRFVLEYIPHVATGKLLSVERVAVAATSARAGTDTGGAYAASGSSMLPASGDSPFTPTDGNSDSSTDTLPLAVPIAALGAAGLGAGFYYRREFLDAVVSALRGYEQTAQDYAFAKGEGVFDSDDYTTYKKANRSDYLVNGAVMNESGAFVDRAYLTASLASKYRYLNETPAVVEAAGQDTPLATDAAYMDSPELVVPKLSFAQPATQPSTTLKLSGAAYEPVQAMVTAIKQPDEQQQWQNAYTNCLQRWQGCSDIQKDPATGEFYVTVYNTETHMFEKEMLSSDPEEPVDLAAGAVGFGELVAPGCVAFSKEQSWGNAASCAVDVGTWVAAGFIGKYLGKFFRGTGIFGKGAEAEQVGKVLKAAVEGKGNFGLGSATREQADVIGRTWVGEGYRVSSDGKALISADGLRQYRPPTYKPPLGKYQANLESRLVAKGEWINNGHIDITS